MNLHGASPLFEDEADLEAFRSSLPTRALGRTLEYLVHTESTNSVALQRAHAGAPHGLVVVAEQQSAGRGRRGRSWEAPAGKGLLFSVLARLDGLPLERTGWVALTAGLSVIHALEKLLRASPLAATLKWPNDIVIRESESGGRIGWRKLGGVLCEGSLASSARQSSYVVVGIGLNVYQMASEFPQGLRVTPTSLLMESGWTLPRTELLAEILGAFEVNLDRMRADTSATFLRHEVESRLAEWWADAQLELSVGGKNVRGRFRGLDDHGQLCLVGSDGERLTLADAEVVGVYRA